MRAMLHRRYLTVLAVVPLLGALATTGAQADTATWNVAEDSYTSQSNAAATHGSATYLGTDAVVGSERRAYLKFTVSNIPTGATNDREGEDLRAVVVKRDLHGAQHPFQLDPVRSHLEQPTGTRVDSREQGRRHPRLQRPRCLIDHQGQRHLLLRHQQQRRHAGELHVQGGDIESADQLALAWTPSTTADPVLGAVGDIACAPGEGVTARTCQQAATAALLAGNDVTVVQTLGDNQYTSGTSAEFAGGYDPSWGSLKYKTDPAPGNHEYVTPGATGYYGYFGASAGDPSKGYYAYNLGAWHIVVLNSELANGVGSAQEVWFRSDLAANHNACTLALWHEPYFSASNATAGRQTLFQDAYNGGVDIVLNGHAHNYERFAPQNPSGVADPAQGVREFVVGTGGKSLWGFTTALATSQVREGNTFGVLKLTLHASSYDWRFVPIAGSTFTDSGAGTCH